MEGSQSNEERSSEDVKISFKRRNLKGKKKFCPKCFSQMRIFGELSGWLLPEEYLCENCGYKGYVAFEQLPIDSAEGKK